MEWIYIAVEIILVFLLGLFIKIFLPSYMEEKGKNLATKEDIEAITRKTEEVQKEFTEGFEFHLMCASNTISILSSILNFTANYTGS